MRTFYQKIGSVLLLLLAGYIAVGQSFSYKSALAELRAIQKQFVPDKRVAVLEVELKDTLQSPVVLCGETDLPKARAQIIQFFTDKKISFVDSIRLLPDQKVGDLCWALGTLSVSNLRMQPGDAAEMASQILMGTPLKVLDVRGNWYRVQTPDHYIGWTDSGFQLVTPKELDRWKESNRFVYNKMSGYAYLSPDRNSGVVTDLVLDDLFEVESEVKGFLKIKIPDGRTGFVPKDECLSWNKWSNKPFSLAPVLAVARKMMGTPYLWGGTSTKAADCSGFVKLSFFSQGVILARDASQQARYGEPVDFTNRGNLQVGDLLFFGRSADRVTHVGIYTGNGDFIHASGWVQMGSIVPGDPKYNPKRILVGARRVLNSLDTEGIVQVKNHPWYSKH